MPDVITTATNVFMVAYILLFTNVLSIGITILAIYIVRKDWFIDGDVVNMAMLGVCIQTVVLCTTLAFLGRST